MKHFHTLFLLSACTASVDSEMPPDDVTESATVRFHLTTVRDERGDTVDFASGEPVHAHDGPEVTLGGTACPDVYKYSYLMAANVPFGRETSPNPLHWKIELKTDVASAEVRVRGGEWRALDADTIELSRDDVPTEGEYFFDVRTIDKAGGETITSACFRFHPLVAPVEVQPARAEALAAMTLVGNAPVSRLLSTTGVRVFSQRIVHHTAEPVTLQLAIAKPSATYAMRVVDDYVISGTFQGGDTCTDAAGNDTGSPMCETTPPSDPADRSASGALASGTWQLQIVDEATGAPARDCTTDNLTARCTLPARAPTGAALSLTAVLVLSDVTELAPSNPAHEIPMSGLVFTGKTFDVVQRCTELREVTKLGSTIVYCAKYAEHTRIHALDHARIAFAPVTFALTANAQAIAHVPAAHATVAGFTWDAGDDDLPGPQ